jgi:hypothetical protein
MSGRQRETTRGQAAIVQNGPLRVGERIEVDVDNERWVPGIIKNIRVLCERDGRSYFDSDRVRDPITKQKYSNNPLPQESSVEVKYIGSSVWDSDFEIILDTIYIVEINRVNHEYKNHQLRRQGQELPYQEPTPIQYMSGQEVEAFYNNQWNPATIIRKYLNRNNLNIYTVNINGREVTLGHNLIRMIGEIPQVQEEVQNLNVEENYDIDELVETKHNDDMFQQGWYLGAVRDFYEYVVRNNRNGQTERRRFRGVRNPTTGEIAEENNYNNFRIGDNVEIIMDQTRNWTPATIIDKKYSVAYYNYNGRRLSNSLLSYLEMRRPTPSQDLPTETPWGTPVTEPLSLEPEPVVRQQVELIKKIEVPEDFVINDTIELTTKPVAECNEEGSIVFVFETSVKEYKTECMSIDYIKSINQRRGSELGNRFMIVEIEGGTYDVIKPNWSSWNKDINSLTVDMVPEPRTFYLEKSNVIRGKETYKLVKLNIVVKPPVPLEQAVAPVEEERVKPNLEEPSNKRSKKRGGKHYRKTNKRGKKKTNKREKKVNKSKSKKVRR